MISKTMRHKPMISIRKGIPSIGREALLIALNKVGPTQLSKDWHISKATLFQVIYYYDIKRVIKYE